MPEHHPLPGISPEIRVQQFSSQPPPIRITLRVAHSGGALYPVGVAERIVYVTRVTRLPLVGADGCRRRPRGRRRPRPRRASAARQRLRRGGRAPARVRRRGPGRRDLERRRAAASRLDQPAPVRAPRRRAAGGRRADRPPRCAASASSTSASRRRPSRSPGRWPRSRWLGPGTGRAGARSAPEVIDWSEAGELFADERPIDRQAAALGGLHPVEMSAAIRRLPLSRRRVLASELEDDRLADLLEELDEDEQVRIVEGLDQERLARVLDEMEADDAADLLGEFSGEPPDRAARRDGPRGGRAGPPPADLQARHRRRPDDARARDPRRRRRPSPRRSPGSAIPTCRCRSPRRCSSATRRSRPRPAASRAWSASSACCARRRASRSARCLDEEWEPIAADASEREVAERLAAYDVVAIPVTDPAKRLVGAVTIDDVLDRMLPADWRIARASR